VKGKKEEEEEEKSRKIVAYSQQAWRRYNHVKTQGWSPCSLLIHAFLLFKPFLMFFELVLVL
jgi:hypothetical protein